MRAGVNKGYLSSIESGQRTPSLGVLLRLAAALRVAQKYRSQPTMEDGRPAAGERTSIAISFKPAS